MKLRRTAPFVLALAALSSIAAVDADGNELPTEPCDNPDGIVVAAPGANAYDFQAGLLTYPHGTAPDPVGIDEDTRNAMDVLVDLSTDDDDDHDSAFVTFTLSWESPGDHELAVYDADGNLVGESTAFNPIDGSEEKVSAFGVEHCSVYTVETKNYAAVPAEPMNLDIEVRAQDDEPDTVAGEAVAADASDES